MKTATTAVLWVCLISLFVHSECPRSSNMHGMASWYGERFAYRRTANGERYSPKELTAAHRTLPFDSYVRVTNLINGLTVDVRINDRGPFIRSRVIDLSEAAARELDMMGSGIVPVRLELLEWPVRNRRF